MKRMLLSLSALVLTLLASPHASANDYGTQLAKWRDHTGSVPFVFGYQNGLAEAKFSGRPMMLFFTTTW